MSSVDPGPGAAGMVQRQARRPRAKACNRRRAHGERRRRQLERLATERVITRMIAGRARLRAAARVRLGSMSEAVVVAEVSVRRRVTRIVVWIVGLLVLNALLQLLGVDVIGGSGSSGTR